MIMISFITTKKKRNRKDSTFQDRSVTKERMRHKQFLPVNNSANYQCSLC